MEHDNSYKLLFAHADLVADLLRGFVHEPWVAELDFDTLERFSSSHVSDSLQDRHDDLIWRVRWRGRDWLYIYLLLEFQATSDPYMAVRLLAYLMLLYQELLRSKQLPPSGRLPPVLPLVLYNGRRPWTAAQNLADLIEPAPGGLEQYCPQLHYLLLEEARYTETELAPLQNLAAALFRLENSPGPQEFGQAVDALSAWLKLPEQDSLARAFLVWINRVFLPSRLPGTDIPSVHTLAEVKAMLAEDTLDWTRQWKQQGREEGRQEGLQQGLQQELADERALLLRLVGKRFGAACAQTLVPLLEPIDDPERLAEVGEWIVTCDTAEAFLARLQPSP